MNTQLDNDHIMHYVWGADFPKLVKGEGIYLYDVNGKKYIDGSSGAVSCSLRHGRKDMAETLYQQASTLAYALRHTTTSKVLEEATDKMAQMYQMDRFFLVSGGTEANEISTKLARIYWAQKGRPMKNKIISRWQSYHGFSTDALSWGGSIARRREFIPQLQEDGHIAPPYCYRCWFGKECGKCNFECANALETEIKCRGAETVAAFICETISGTTLAGVTPPDGYYQRIREICDKCDVLLIVDEVLCGSGRTGKMMAIDHYGVKPDIASLAKSMSGGYFPVGAVACTEKIAEPIRRSGHFSPGYTWAGAPLPAAVVSKTMDIIKEEHLLENVTEVGSYMEEQLRDLQTRHPSMGDVRGKGLMWGIEYVKDRKTRESFDQSVKFAATVAKNCLDMGLLICSCKNLDMGEKGDASWMGPCFEITKTEIDELLDIYEKALTKTEKQLM